MFCNKCGKEIHDEAVICTHCGCEVSGIAKQPAPEKPISKGLSMAMSLIPFVGIVLGIVWLSNNSNSKNGRDSLICGIGCFVVWGMIIGFTIAAYILAQ